MPIVNTNQVRIELTREQFLGIVEHMVAKFPMRDQVPHTIFIEETNLGKTVVVGGNPSMTMFLAYSGGEVDELKTVT